jgi:hypothetical protein
MSYRKNEYKRQISSKISQPHLPINLEGMEDKLADWRALVSHGPSLLHLGLQLLHQLLGLTPTSTSNCNLE